MRRTEAILARVKRRFPRRFGFFEVALYAQVGSLHLITRHLAIVNALEEIRDGRDLRVLDFGGGSGFLASMLRVYGLARFYRLTLADVDSDAVRSARLYPPLVEVTRIDPAGVLPFDDDAFDVVVSSDVFEHIPRDDRARWATECTRVACTQVHNIPCGPSSGEADAAYQAWHVERFGRPEPWTAEHLANVLPTLNEVAAWFPGAELSGMTNTRQWLATMEAEAHGSRIRRVLRALDYMRRYRVDLQPPFKSAFVVQRRRS